ncbi:hypothetical protein SteCoe_4791 [Stentor coeruleus]|uniref:Uncharacterized protein n=1 Tax=Stentor coeruleus TaxID=5963 RepID=A0A1R2CTY0_9CILI|nr:hypothetical protein SteCoe_4791 [Stentor coeruleus]
MCALEIMCASIFLLEDISMSEIRDIESSIIMSVFISMILQSILSMVLFIKTAKKLIGEFKAINKVLRNKRASILHIKYKIRENINFTNEKNFETKEETKVNFSHIDINDK